MTTTTLSPGAHATQAFVSNSDISGSRKEYKKTKSLASGKKQEVFVLEGVPVFRSGVFRDSWGDQKEWTDLHIQQMVQNFNYLRDSGSFADVPVRLDHPSFFGGSLAAVIGYLTGLTAEEMISPVDGKKYTYAVADYEILDTKAQENIESGLWRNRSAEIGTFVTNSEAEFSPCLMGFAYVDIPAVEGLHLNGYSKNGKPTGKVEFSMVTNKGDEVANTQHSAPNDGLSLDDDAPGDSSTSDNNPPAAPNTVPAAPASGEQDPPATGAPAGADGTQEVPVSPSFDDDADDDEPVPVTEQQPGPVGVPPEDADDEDDDEDEEDDEPIELTEQPPGPIFSNGALVGHFSIGGKKTQDFAKVQKHINTLESAQREASAAKRKAFCAKLAKKGVILASDLTDTEAFAASLNDDQYAKWSAQQSRAPQNALFAQHGQQVDSKKVSAELEDYSTQLEIMHTHLRTNTSPEVYKKYPSYIRLTELATKLGKDLEADLKIK
jgi:hypothetical protein